jgi:hypothetical protein
MPMAPMTKPAARPTAAYLGHRRSGCMRIDSRLLREG